MIRLFNTLSLLFLVLNLFAQTTPDAICEEGDCPTEVFSIQLDEPNQPASYSAERLETFIQAYLAFKIIRDNLKKDLDWKEKYDAFQLGGESCLRYYQLESSFGHEFQKNPDFKSFVEKEDPQAAPQMSRNGFRSSRRAVNLARRMETHCPEKKESTEQKGGTPVASTTHEYQNLGLALGYFDEKGNVIKALEPPKEYKPRNRMSKNERVENLNKKVADLPIGPKATEEVDKVAEDLKKAAPKFEGLKNFISAFAPLASAFLPNPLTMVGNIGKATDLLGKLLNVKLNFPQPALFNKIKDLFGKGKKLKDKAQDLVDKGKDLLNVSDEFKDKTDKLGEEFKHRNTGVADLRNKLKDLEQKKQEVFNKLGDKPKKILEDLEKEVAQLEDEAKAFKDLLDDEQNKKDKLLKNLDDLLKEKEKLEKTLDDLKKKNEDLEQKAKDLQKETDDAKDQVDKAQQQEAALDKDLKKMADVPNADDLKKSLKLCEDDLKKFLEKYAPVDQVQSKLNEKMAKVKDLPEKLMDKVKNLKIFQKQLKNGKDGNPLVGRSLNKLDELSDKANTVGSVLEILTGKRTKLQDRLQQIDGKIGKAKDVYDNRANVIDKLQNDALALLLEKSGLEDKMARGTASAEDMSKEINDFLEKFKLFKDESECIDLESLEDKLEEAEKKQAEIEPEIEELEKELEEAGKQQETIQQETEALEELSEEQEKLQEQLGDDVNLDPVQPEEWAEDFEVKRDYWEAIFHPDDEVVEGYKGRYFQVRLKDANKNVKLLFGPGEYFMERADFRDTYGSVIGVFVTEALNAMRKSDRDGIKLFVQGSADITGQSTFKGNLSDKFMYDEVTVLPMKGDSDRFKAETTALTIPTKGFTNDDLPNLRGNFLREMISIYSRKLQPVLLEGSVTEKVDIEDRNAVIYLFIPEYLVENYSRD